MSQTIIGTSGRGSYQTYAAPQDKSFYLESLSYIIEATSDVGARFAAVGIGTQQLGVTTNAIAPESGGASAVIQVNFGIGYVATVIGATTGWIVNAPLPELLIDQGAIVWVGSFREGGGTWGSDIIGDVYLQAEIADNAFGLVTATALPIPFMPGPQG